MNTQHDNVDKRVHGACILAVQQASNCSNKASKNIKKMS